jgi:hypothetical protein
MKPFLKGHLSFICSYKGNMRLENKLRSYQSFFENIGTCRISSFFPKSNKSRGRLAEKVGRSVLAVIAALSLYDLATHEFSFKIKVAVHGTLIFFIGCLAVSVLLKLIFTCCDKNPVKRSLTNSFNEAVDAPDI